MVFNTGRTHIWLRFMCYSSVHILLYILWYVVREYTVYSYVMLCFVFYVMLCLSLYIHLIVMFSIALSIVLPYDVLVASATASMSPPHWAPRDSRASSPWPRSAPAGLTSRPGGDPSSTGLQRMTFGKKNDGKMMEKCGFSLWNHVINLKFDLVSFWKALNMRNHMESCHLNFFVEFCEEILQLWICLTTEANGCMKRCMPLMFGKSMDNSPWSIQNNWTILGSSPFTGLISVRRRKAAHQGLWWCATRGATQEGQAWYYIHTQSTQTHLPPI